MKIYFFFFTLIFQGIINFCYSQNITPKDITGLQLWLRADSAATIHLSGSNVTIWDDCSGNGNNATQSNSSNQPIYNNSISLLNNKPAISFNGSSNSLSFPLLSSTEYSFFTVISTGTSKNTYEIFLGSSQSTGARWALAVGSDAVDGIGWAGSNANVDLGNSNFILVNNFYILSFIKSTTGWNIYCNGSFIRTVYDASFPTYSNTWNWVIGSETGLNYYLSGYIADIIIYNKALADNERQNVEDYLRYKYFPPVNLGKDTILNKFCNYTLNAGDWFSSYLWSTGTTTQSINVDSSGTYWVEVTDAFGYKSHDTLNVSYPLITLNDTSFCSGNSIVLSTGLIGSYTYNWTGGLTSPTINVSTPGNYSVTVTDDSLCSAVSPTIYVTEDDFPAIASLGPDKNICSGNTIGLISPSPLPSGLTYNWSTMETTPEITITDSGIYSVTVTDSSGCKATDNINVTIIGTAPNVNFSTNTGCSTEATLFSNNSSPAGTSWLWDFGDGQTSTSENPSHIFSNGGNYNVKLTVYDGSCSNSLTKETHIPYTPIPSFTVSSACINNPYTFYDQSTSPEGNIISWDWDFGDGTVHSTDTNPTHTFTSANTYIITLTIVTDSGCTSSIQNQITVVDNAPSPMPFTLYLPSNDFTTTDNNINFSWNTSENATSYTLQYSTDSTFTTNVISIPNLIQNTLQLNLNAYGKYYWRVTAYGLCGDYIITPALLFSIFSLNSITGLDLWLRADSAATIHLSGSNVTIWDDCSGNGNNATQSNSSNQPIYNNSISLLNNKPAISFNGSSNSLSFPLLSSTEYSFFTVISTGTSKNTYEIFLGSSQSTGARWALAVGSDAVDGIGWAGSNANVDLGNSNFILVNNFYILSFIKSTTGWNIYCNGSFIRTVYDASFPTYSNTWNWVIGSETGLNYYLSGYIADIIIYNKALADNERQNVEDYLRYKYFPPVNLESDIWVNNFCVDTIDAGNRFVSYLWNTGDTTSKILVNSGDTVWVDVVDGFGFTSSDTIIVHKPILNINTNDTLCLGDSTTLHTGMGSPYSVMWEWQNDTINGDSYIIHAGDSVMLHVFDTVGCSATRLITMYADSFPLMDLLGASTASICSDDTVFPAIDTSLITSYDWYDGTSHYTTPYYIVPISWVGTGSHNLSLTSYNHRGCKVSDVVAVSAPGQKPFAAFSATAGCEPFTTAFTNLSTVPSPAFINYRHWDFGDGDTSIFNSPTHQFAEPGKHLVTLTVSTNKGCSASITDTAYVYSKPKPKFSPIIGCSGVPLQFTDKTTNVLGEIDTWTWEFNDPYSTNNTSSIKNPSHIYDSTGYYWVILTAQSEYGCTATDSAQIHIRLAPKVDFSYTNVCDGNPVYFTNETVDVLGIVSQNWDFGDGNSYTINSPVYTFDSAGTFPVSLTVQSINGCIVSDTENVIVHSIPEINYTAPDSICASYSYILDDNSFVLPPDSITQWSWVIENIGTFNEENPSVTFTSEGDYPVTLTVSSNAGCSDNVSATIHVNPIPTASFLPDEFYGMPPFTVNFTNNSVNALSSYWNFGDGTSSSLLNPQHTYNSLDTFNVMLVVTNSALCTDTAYQELYSIPTTADVGVTNVVTDQQNGFINVSADLWNYGTRKIYELYLYAKAAGGTMFMESWSDYTNPILPGTSIPYTFNAQFAISEENNFDYICVEAQIPNVNPDDNPSNNEECITIKNKFTAFIPFPTPTNDIININFILPFKGQVDVDLYGEKGELVEHVYSGEANKGLNKIQYDISKLNLGVYVYRITFNNDFKILKFVKY
ncbi:MAG TPA: PKD domain-containing protein [Bacteroidales bacterium]|nr:PKD domain-containing protein [Bacteroidales bacterium]HPS15978.1 PKD domain-containing protein [Bacteroidales bacterium]